MIIDAIKSEIEFLKSNNLDKKLWKDNTFDIIKRLTSEIKVKDEDKKHKLINEVKDFINKGKGRDDSFDFIFQDSDKFFKEIHIYHHKDQFGKEKVIARIDKTIKGEDGEHKPFENYITIEYKAVDDEDDGDEGKGNGSSDGGGLIADRISFFGTEYVPFPANLVFAEHMFSHMASHIIGGISTEKDHYKNIETQIITDVPDIYATPDHKQKHKKSSSQIYYKKQSLKKTKREERIEEFKKDILLNAFRNALMDHDIRNINAEALTEEDIFRNLVNKVSATTELEQEKLKKEAKEFFDPNFGDNSFDMRKEIANGTILYEIEKNRQDRSINASAKFVEFSDMARGGKVKSVNYFNMINMIYVEDPNNEGEYVLKEMLMFGRPWNTSKEWEDLGLKFYNYLLYELGMTDSNIIDIEKIRDIVPFLMENQKYNIKYIDNRMLEEMGISLNDNYEDANERYERLKRERLSEEKLKEEHLRIKKKYENVQDLQLKLK